jgi:hypothetical protein
LSAPRQRYAPFGGEQELNSHLLLEMPNSASYGRVTEIKLLGGIIERFGSRDLKEKPQLVPRGSTEQPLVVRWR